MKYDDPEHISHVEQCIADIHFFLDHDYFAAMSCYYTGCNMHKSYRRKTRYTLVNGKYVSDITLEEHKGALKEIKAYIKKNGPTKHEFGLFCTTQQNHIKAEMERPPYVDRAEEVPTIF